MQVCICWPVPSQGQISEDQKTQDAQDDGERHENTGYPVEEPEQSPETHDGHGCPYGGYAVRIKPAERDGGCEGQCCRPCPPVAGYFPDFFFRFHNLHVLWECHSRFRGLSCRPPPQARFSGENTGAPARMIFPGNRKARPCRWNRAGCDLCPANRDGSVISSFSRFWGMKVSG